MREGAVRIAACTLLGFACLAWYAPTLHYGFVFDDRELILENEMVLQGPSLHSMAWALSSGYGATWQPATWISYLTDVAVFGGGPRGFHVTNVMLHAANVVLVFLLVLAIAERDRHGLLKGRSATLAAAFVAALFAFHPQTVEPVAWIASRKDVLSTLLCLVALLTYLRFVDSGRSWLWGVVVVATALGLMAKAMVVTLPFLLLLLDFWPLGRFSAEDFSSAAGRARIVVLVREKVPLFALCMAAAVVTYGVQSAGGAVSSTDVLPIPIRLANAISSYLEYLEKAVVPTGLSVAYPYTSSRLRPERLLAGAVLLSAITYWAFRRSKAAPWFTVGWLWFLGTLVPVIGLVPVGSHAMADRYTYLPHLGLWIGLSWGIGGLAVLRPRIRPAIVGFGLVVVAACLILSREMLPTWTDEISLFSHAARSTPASYVAHYNLAFALAKAGREEEALQEYRAAIELHPNYLEARTNLAALLADRGEPDAAEAEYAYVAAHASDHGLAYFNLARLQMTRGRTTSAEETVLEGVSFAPDHAPLLNLLGVLRLRGGRPAEAIAPLERALQLDASSVEIVNNLGVAYRESGQPEDSSRVLESGVRLRPNSVPLLLNLGLAYAAAGRHLEALQVYARASQLAPQSGEIAAAQAVSHSALGQQESAEEAWKRAVARAPADAESRLRLGLALIQRADMAGAEAQLIQLERLDTKRAAELRRALEERSE